MLLYFSAVLIAGVPFPFGVQGRVWNSIVSVPDHCLFIYIEFQTKKQRFQSPVKRMRITGSALIISQPFAVSNCLILDI